MNKEITKNLFIVEGSTDKNFMEQFIELFIEREQLNKEPHPFFVKVIKDHDDDNENNRGGKSKFFKDSGVDNILALIKSASTDECLPKTFLIVDADWKIHHDLKQPAGFSNVNKRLKEIENQIKSNNYITEHFGNDQFDIDHFIMPFNSATKEFGELETLFINALKPEYQKKLNCLDELENCLKVHPPKPDIQEHHRDKMRMEILLTSYNIKMDKAINWIDYNNKNLNDIKNFLRKNLKLEKVKTKK